MSKKTYITICKDLANSSLLLSASERTAIARLVEDAEKWRNHVKATTVSNTDLNAILSHYLDIKMIPNHQRKGMYRMLYKPAKELLNKCGSLDVAKTVIDRINVKFAELPNWSLYACVKHCERIINE